MDEIKSALEIAMERVAKLGEATEEERLRWEYIPEGEKLALRYLNQDSSLVVELSRYEEKAKKYVIKGAERILLGNINLPGNDVVKRNNKRAMDALKSLKSDKIAMENVYSKIRHIFNHYVEMGEQQRKQAYVHIRAEFEGKIQRAVQEQLGSAMAVKIDVENHPQFQEEWRKTLAQLDLHYIQYLDEYKKELSGIN